MKHSKLSHSMYNSKSIKRRLKRLTKIQSKPKKKKERKMANKKTAKKKRLKEQKRQEEARRYVQSLLHGGKKDG